MKATWKLLAMPARRMPVGAVLVALLYLGGLIGAVYAHEPAVLFATGMACWFWHLMAGFALRGLLRAETLLLPRFRAYLALAGAADVLLAVVVPTAVFVALAGPQHIALLASGLLLASVIGLATGLGMRAMMLLWLVFVAAGWMPRLTDAVGHAALTSPWTPLALLLSAALLLSLALRPLLTIRDRGEDESPMQAIADGRKPAPGADGTPRARGFIGKRLNALFDGSAQRALAAALSRMQKNPTPSARMALVRAVLLPHDNPAAVGMRVVWVGLIAAVYFFATHAAQRWHAGYVGAYAVAIAIGRFGAVGQGMLRMRPNLADLYMTLAPATRRNFQATLADTLLWLVGVSIFNCLAYAALVAVLLHSHEPARLILAAGITGIGAAFGALSVHLIGPESPTGRGLMQIVLMAAAAGVYALVFWLLGRFGLAIGAAAALILTLPFGIGAWQAARREYLQRAPRFDAPVG
jgi:hypothetical protein